MPTCERYIGANTWISCKSIPFLSAFVKIWVMTSMSWWLAQGIKLKSCSFFSVAAVHESFLNSYAVFCLKKKKRKQEDTEIHIKDAIFGNNQSQFIVGPCAVERYEQLAEVAKALK